MEDSPDIKIAISSGNVEFEFKIRGSRLKEAVLMERIIHSLVKGMYGQEFSSLMVPVVRKNPKSYGDAPLEAAKPEKKPSRGLATKLRLLVGPAIINGGRPITPAGFREYAIANGIEPSEFKPQYSGTFLRRLVREGVLVKHGYGQYSLSADELIKLEPPGFIPEMEGEADK